MRTAPRCVITLMLSWIVCTVTAAKSLAAADSQTGVAFRAAGSGNLGRRDDKAGEGAWAAARLKTTDEALLDFFRKRTPPVLPLGAVKRLAKALGDKDQAKADAAQEELIRLGPCVVAMLREVVNQVDELQARSRAETILQIVEGPLAQDLILEAARLLATRKPAGAAEVLLNYVPFAGNDLELEKIEAALAEVGVVNGKADAALVQALNDSNAVRRAEAALALWRGRATDALPLVRKLLADKDKEVRRRVALELVSSSDKEAALTLAGLLVELSGDQVWRVEESLESLAGGKAPAEIESDPVDWKKVAIAWKEWWQGERSKVVFVDTCVPAQGGKLLGYRLLVQKDSVTEVDANGKRLWRITGLAGPLMDATVLPHQRVLIVEADRVTVRDFQGKILWRKEVSNPVVAQRLRNGNTFIACDRRLMEVDRDGKEVVNISLAREIKAARKLPNGHFVTLDLYGIHWRRFDRMGHDLTVNHAPSDWQRDIGSDVFCTSSLHPEFLDNGRLLGAVPRVKDYGTGCAASFVEFDPYEDKVVHNFELKPEQFTLSCDLTYGFRLPNGHVLVTILGRKYVELDENWRLVREVALDSLTSRVKGR